MSTLDVLPARLRLRWLLAANVAVVLLLAVLVASMLADSRNLHRQRALDAVDSLAQGMAQNVAAELALVDLALRQLRLAAQDGDAARTAAAVRDLSRSVPSALRLRVVPDPTVTPFEPGLFPPGSLATDRLLVVGPRPREDGQWVVLLARPPRQGSGPATVAEFDIARFEALFAGLNLGGRSAISLRMDDLSLVARHTDPPQPRSGLGTRSTSSELLGALARSPESGTYLAATALDGIERANAYRRVPGAPMRVLVGLATVDTMAPWRRQAATTATVAGLAVLLVAAVSVLAYRAWRRDDQRRDLLDAERVRLQGVLVTAGDGLHVLDRNGVLVEFNDAFAHMLGTTREDLAGAHVMRWEQHFPASQVDHVLRSFAVGKRLRFDSVFRRADGELIDVAIAATGVRAQGRDLLILWAHDMTDIRRARRRLEASEALLERTGRIAGIGGWEFDPAGGRMALTAQASRLLGVSSGATPGLRTCLRRMPRDQRRAIIRGLRQVLASGQAWQHELPLFDSAGHVCWLHCTAERVEDDAGPRVAGVLRDVTERHERHERLQQEQTLRMQLQRHADAQASMLQEREAMLDVLAHEVRQPLNNASAAMQSALGSLRDVGEQAVAPRLQRAQLVLGQVTARLDNTLAVASLLARQGPVTREDTDLDTLLAVTIADMPAAERGRIKVQRDTAARTVSLDTGLMRLALRNLLSNALKYSPPGSPVTVRVADSEQPLGLVIDVIDRGTGIEPGLRSHLFERGARGRATPGAEHGLGLYIVRRVMELHGGQASLQASGPDGTVMRLLVAEDADD
ncbi:MAG: PAS domain S-box protein [Burkholderiaceae bacterium]|nr:PAS domain S-box protein [Burkholderiaceae bacterium]